MVYCLDITRRLHQRLLYIVRVALPLIPASMGDADMAGLAHLREEMIEAIDAYSRHTRQLHDTALAAGDAARLAEADMLMRGCAALGDAYDAFRARWAHRHAMDNWHEYRLSAVVMMKQVRSHIQSAERQRPDGDAFAA